MTLTQKLSNAFWYRADYRPDSPERWARVVEAIAQEIATWEEGEPDERWDSIPPRAYRQVADRLLGSLHV